ncbi:DUF3500 domain-containing protein [Streptomyces sp. NPDC093591]|uniref:DUF3500 domain-containing protein n=1 Tax=Streptomyces sp. NPDC093591 TaxID=3366044 RepID=UPI0037F8C49B
MLQRLLRLLRQGRVLVERRALGRPLRNARRRRHGPQRLRGQVRRLRGRHDERQVQDDLYSFHSTNVSTDALVKAAQGFLDDEWLAWSNVDGYSRKGVRRGDLTDKQRDLGFALLGAALSADGLTQSRNIMKLNAYLGEYSGGKETLTEGHHRAINYFVLGDQVVMTPTFMGSEPTSATYQGEKITLFKKETKPSTTGCTAQSY